MDVPASLPFLDVVSYVLNQLHLMKEDTFCFKGDLLGNKKIDWPNNWPLTKGP